MSTGGRRAEREAAAAEEIELMDDTVRRDIEEVICNMKLESSVKLVRLSRMAVAVTLTCTITS